MRTLILGVGSSILTDDSVGLVVASRLGERLAGRDDVDVGTNEEAGFSLLEESLGYDRLIIIDSILTGKEPGAIVRLSLDDLSRTIHSNSPHGANLATVMELGRRQNMDVPDEVVIYAIEAVDVLTFGEELTPALAARVDSIVDEIAGEIFPEVATVGRRGEKPGIGELYDLPLYYDVAFSWDIEPEIGFFESLFREHVPLPVRRMLEPACGTGRFLVKLPKHGYRVTGYDASPAMLDYARRRVEAAGTSGLVTLVHADMESATFPREFDAALNSINSLGYLLEDEDIVSHLRLTGEALRPGGIYIVHISCAWDGPPDMEHNTWEAERDGVRVRTAWRIEREDRDARRSYHVCTMEIDDHGERRVLVDRHTFRLWVFEEFKELIERCGTLVLDAVYTDSPKHERVPLDSHINGEMGNLYYILKAR